MLEKTDPEIHTIIEKEKNRQMNGLELIPSENLVSKSVLEAMGSVLTNKYSEGYPGRRYYGGNEYIDVAETLAIERAKKLFDCEHVNVQPLSGSPANMAVYFAFLKPGDKFMGMELSHGGHLTHGHKMNFSGIFYNAVQYGVDKETEMIDFDAIRRLALQESPIFILSGYTAYPRAIDFRRFKEIADEAGAISFADISHIAGLCAAGLHENPVPYFDVVMTTTHKTLRGPRGAIVMCKEEHAKIIDKAVFPGLQGGPHEHIIAAKAVAFREALEPNFVEYAKQIIRNAKVLADTLMDFGFRLVTGGTDNHLILVDVQNKDMSGKEAETLLGEVGITVNKNTIPFDARKPFDPSGIRLGTPLLTTRGMKESEMRFVGECINKTIENKDDPSIKEKIRGDVLEMCRNFVFYE
jgi:glycine hydroxymethyltransferase